MPYVQSKVDFPIRKLTTNRRKTKISDAENKLSSNRSKKRLVSGTDSDSPSKKRSVILSCYQQAKKALHSSLPSRLLGRDRECSEIRTFLKNHLADSRAGSLYVSGAPGTGKTATLIRLIESMVNSFKYVYINCMSLKQSNVVYQKISKELGYKSDLSQKGIAKYLERTVVTSKDMIVLVLDEIDQLDSKNQEVLYTLFEWPQLPNSKIILIGVANALDLTDRVLPRLLSYGCKPQLLHFHPYTHEQIYTILQDRLKDVDTSKITIFKPSALLLCARKIAASSGDVRKALDVCRRAVELLEIENKRAVLQVSFDDGCNAGSPKKLSSPKELFVDIPHINSVLNEIYGSRVLSASITKKDDKNDMPFQQKVILCILLLTFKTNKLKEITIGKLHNFYSHICKRRQISALDQIEFSSTCSLLELQGLVYLKKAKDTRLSKISLKINEQELECVLQDRTLMASILADSSVVKTLKF